ncbi:hypothetical protein CH63R_04971 [Colletotrichum higginsianum IMI 349063]|uniref:Uncharacterized protein n=1 Tax=Colletotrichum higginsianum (strain IMI 349063) TaxID=759273 RepID=A0A1B7YKZ0_COLHI|nr:hypothetical protein CH63R_04971 [Colletotrichum higginsianum IMI 349063]OBR12675.1 hypothetical protein CH63R_04971 [Colletotrichum higginsianum IMI 349063]
MPWLGATTELGETFPRNTTEWDDDSSLEGHVQQPFIGSATYDEPHAGTAASDESSTTPDGLGETRRDGAAQLLGPAPRLLYREAAPAAAVAGAWDGDESRGTRLRLSGWPEGRCGLDTEALRVSPRTRGGGSAKASIRRRREDVSEEMRCVQCQSLLLGFVLV